MILAGDIGGTHARLALYRLAQSRLVQVRHEVYASRDYIDLKQVLQSFMAATAIKKVEAASFGIAGPVIEDSVVTSNLPWVVQGSQLREILGTPSVWLLNDLMAATYGIAELEEGDFLEVNACTPVRGNRAVIFAGTGLGESLSIWHDGRYFPSPSEGGHSDFSPKNKSEMELCEFLSKNFGHVSWERVLSGHGIINLYQFIKSKYPYQEPSWLTEEMKISDPCIAIVRAACTHREPSCQRAVELFVSFLGREAGNLALKGLATGGVYIGGGIAPRLKDLIKSPLFLDEFSAKGRMSGLLEKTPVRLILNSDVGLIGAARFAALSIEKNVVDMPHDTVAVIREA